MTLPSRNFPFLVEKAVCCGEVGDGLIVRCIDEYSRMSRMEESSGARLTGRTGTEREGQKGGCGSVLEVRRAGALASLDEPECVPASLWGPPCREGNLYKPLSVLRKLQMLWATRGGRGEEGRDKGKGLQQLPGVRWPTRLPHFKC